MLRLPKIIANTLSFKLSLMIVLPMTILLMASLVVMLHYSRKTVKEEALQKATQTLVGTVQQIDNILLSVEQASGNSYFALLPHLDNPEMVHTFCKKMVENNPNITGCAIAFKPGYYPGQQLFMAYYHRTTVHSSQFTVHSSQFTVHSSQFTVHSSQSTVHSSQSTVHSPQSTVHSPQSTVHSSQSTVDSAQQEIVQSNTFANVPYTEQVWYTKPMATGKPGWLNPLEGLDTKISPIITFCLPIHGSDGQPVAVMGVDVSLNLLTSILLESKPSPHSYCILLTDDGSFIVHPDSTKLFHETVFTQTEKGTDPSVKLAAEAMVSGKTGYMPFRMNGTDYYVFFKPFTRLAVPGRSLEELKWSAGIIYPEDDIFGPYNSLVYYVLAIAIVGMMLLLFLSRTIIHRQLKPLLMLAEKAQLIAKGNYYETIPGSRQHDEIGRLQDNFQHMQQSLAAHIGELEQLTATMKERGQELSIAYRQAQKADRMKTAFLHNMTNQMVAPAANITRDVNALCTNTSPQHIAQLTDIIQKNGTTITNLLNNLLTLSDEENEKGKGGGA